MKWVERVATEAAVVRLRKWQVVFAADAVGRGRASRPRRYPGATGVRAAMDIVEM